MGSVGGTWPTAGTTLHKSEMEQIYAYDFVKKGYLRLLTLFWKYHILDKHFKHGFKIFRPVFSNLIYTMVTIILLHEC